MRNRLPLVVLSICLYVFRHRAFPKKREKPKQNLPRSLQVLLPIGETRNSKISLWG